ncbi:MAG TPA: Os1348 family NHLP clan protein [Devosiaceae bacterium]|jgi:hypothetical protein|nr:Os1348 family NHLP clan protein [Devosiaceae bacterium]
MNQAEMERLVERWMRDAEFRDRMRAAPLETVAAEGYDLTEEEQQALQQLDLSLSDEELSRQASFGT